MASSCSRDWTTAQTLLDFCCCKGTSRNLWAPANVLSNPRVDEKFMLRLWVCLQWPSWFCLSFRVIQFLIMNTTWGQLVFHWFWDNKTLWCTERACGAWPWTRVSCRDAGRPPCCEKSNLWSDKYQNTEWKHLSKDYCSVISSSNNVIT